MARVERAVAPVMNSRRTYAWAWRAVVPKRIHLNHGLAKLCPEAMLTGE